MGAVPQGPGGEGQHGGQAGAGLSVGSSLRVTDRLLLAPPANLCGTETALSPRAASGAGHPAQPRWPPTHRPGCGTGLRPHRNLGARQRSGWRDTACGEDGGGRPRVLLTVFGEIQDVVLSQVGLLDLLLKRVHHQVVHGE